MKNDVFTTLTFIELNGSFVLFQLNNCHGLVRRRGKDRIDGYLTGDEASTGLNKGFCQYRNIK